MVHAIRFDKTGGPEVLLLAGGQTSASRGQARCGSSTRRSGSITSTPISAAGSTRCRCRAGSAAEAAGIVEEVGPGVSGLKPGDRVAYAGGPIGAYAEGRVMPADRLVPVPDGITDQQAAAMMLKGMTAWYLVRRTHPVKTRRDDPDPCRGRWGRADRLPMGQASRRHRDRHRRRRRKGRARQGSMAATIRSSIAARISSRGSTRSPTAKSCPWSMIRSARTRSTNRSTAWRRSGLMASFGQSSGAIGPVDIGILAAKGSLYLTRPTLDTYTATREDLLTAARELFEVVQSGAVKIVVNQTYPLRDAARPTATSKTARPPGRPCLRSDWPHADSAPDRWPGYGARRRTTTGPSGEHRQPSLPPMQCYGAGGSGCLSVGKS